jgi:hypothetical protein
MRRAPSARARRASVPAVRGSRLRRLRWQASIGAGLVALVVVLWGGYHRRWSWTGFGDNDTLWNWLELLLLPLVLASAPIWVEKRGELHATRRRVLFSLLAAFVVLVVVGYAFDLRWTGFPGNHLWDWFTLLLLPLAVATFGIWQELGRKASLKHWLAVAIFAGAFGLFVAGGYALDWGWTGFEGNTLWDWINLLLAPLLFSLVVVPTAVAWISAEVEERAEREAS